MKFSNLQASRIKVLCTTCAFLLLASCFSSEDQELTRYIKSVKLRKARPVEPIPTFAPLPVFSYPENDTRRNPFKPKIIQVAAVQGPDTKRPKQPLEKFALDALKFVGVLKEGDLIWGLISLPSGEVVRIRQGEYMGKNYGKVIKITEKQIKLQELMKTAGKWEKQSTTINLNTGQ